MKMPGEENGLNLTDGKKGNRNGAYYRSPKHWELRSSEPHHLGRLLGAKKLRPRRMVYHDPETKCEYEYRSRPHRKNRHMSPKPKDSKETLIIPSPWTVLKLDLMNISWHVAFWFTLGSAAWIVNGHFAMWPVPNSEKNTYIVGYSALAGGLLFQIGSYCGVLESLNENRNLDTSVLHDTEDKVAEEEDGISDYLSHRFGSKPNKPKKTYISRRNEEKHADREKWRWWGYDPESMGYWAAVTQFTGATFFTVSVICMVPGVIHQNEWRLQQTFQWTPQVVGALGFIISSIIMMLEEQSKWYIPALDKIGWHAPFWNLIGAIGFLLSPIFAYLANWEGHGVVCCQFWGTAFNTYYGSWAFLVSSLLMLFEAQNPDPQSSAVRALERMLLLAQFKLKRRFNRGRSHPDRCGGEDEEQGPS